VWTFVLVSEHGSTRLISRNRIAMTGARRASAWGCSSWSPARWSWNGRCCLSVGGLYYYFPAKRELLLYGLRPEAQMFVCSAFWQRNTALRAADPPGYLDAFLGHQVEMALFVRPSLRAAAEIGLSTLETAIESTVSHAASGICHARFRRRRRCRHRSWRCCR
jgi:hypothetical protein